LPDTEDIVKLAVLGGYEKLWQKFVKSVCVYEAFRGKGSSLDFGVVGTRRYHAAAAVATHEQVLHEHVLGFVVPWQLLPEREPPNLE
jgi:hypothetical protein